MQDTLYCDVCGTTMTLKYENCQLSCGHEVFHAEAPVWMCKECGYQKLASCRVQLWMDDIPEEESEAALSLKRSLVGKPEHWIDYLIEKRPWFHNIYTFFVPKRHRALRYLSRRIPDYQAIVDNVFYDTNQARLFLTEDKELGKEEICRIFYYVTKSGKYFSVTTQMDRKDDLDILNIKEIKKLLSRRTDIYMDVIPDSVEDFGENDTAVEDEANPAFPDTRKPIL